MAAFTTAISSDGDAEDKMAEFFGPGHADQLLRSAINACWMVLPKDRRNVDELDRQVRRMVDRALRDLREDQEQFLKR